MSISFSWLSTLALLFNLGIVSLETVGDCVEVVEVSLLMFWKLARNGAVEVVEGRAVEVSLCRTVSAGFMKGFV